METPPLTPRSPKPEPVGPMVAIVIIVLVLAIGGIYFFIKNQAEKNALPPEDAAASAATANP